MFRRKYINTGIAILYFLIFCLTTYPLIFKIYTHIPGFFSTDESYAILWNAWRIKFSVLNHISLQDINVISYPFGIQLGNNQPISYVWVFINYILAMSTSPVLVYNVQAIINFLLSAFTTYVLVYFLTKDRLTAVFSGIIFGFCPYIFVRSWQQLGETYIWPIPLFLWSLFSLRHNYSLKAKLIFILSVILAAINYAVIYYVFVVVIAFLAYSLCRKDRDRYLGRVVILFLVAGIILMPQFLPVFKTLFFSKQAVSSAWNIYSRPFEDLFMQSARPLSYFLPSVAHPIFGKFTESFVGTKLYGMSFTEHTLYLGWCPLILAFVTFRKWRRNVKAQVKENNYIGFFVLLAIVAWFWSQPPWWNLFGFKLYMPSFFMYKLLPMFRAYCRFGVVVMFAVAVLAGFGLKFILEKYKSQRARIFVVVLSCSLVLFEFWNWPPYKVIDVSNFPAVYSWLREQPKDIVIAEYPLDAGSPNEMYKLYQIKHGKRMINCTIPGTPAHAFAQKIIKLSDPHITPILRRMRVSYILVHHQGYLKTGLFEDREEMKRIPGNNNLRLIKSYPGEECPDSKIMCIKDPGRIDLYEIASREPD